MIFSQNELARWQDARTRLVDLIDGVRSEIRRESSKPAPRQARLELLEEQYRLLLDARYQLAVSDEKAIEAAMNWEITVGDRRICFKPQHAEQPV